MSYPNYVNKHLFEALIMPDHFGSGKKFIGKIPKRCIILYQALAFKYLLKKFKGKYRCLKTDFSWAAKIYSTNDFIFVLMNGIGSPHAALVFEELIAIGVNDFLNIGIAGGLNGYGIFLCDRSIRDEGTSQHYLSHSKYAYPDLLLTRMLEKSLTKNKLKFEKGSNWTIDAPFRETKKEIQKYRKEGVVTVEMEASALFSIAKVRNVKIGAAFIVNDVLGEEWEEFKEKDNARDFYKLVDSAIDCLTRK